jgi:hypothetical protein
MRWAPQVTRMEQKSIRNFSVKSDGKKPLRIPRSKREDNIKIKIELNASELVEPQLLRSCEYVYEHL